MQTATRAGQIKRLLDLSKPPLRSLALEPGLQQFLKIAHEVSDNRS